MRKARLVVEGHGELDAAPILMNRLWRHLGLSPDVAWDSPAIRSPRDLKRQDAVVQACELVRPKRDTAMLLVLRDDEDGCPAKSGPETASWVHTLGLPFPTSVVMAYREFETWFLPSIHSIAGVPLPNGRPGLRPGVAFAGSNYEGSRDSKYWLTEHMNAGRRYSETMDQAGFTRLLDLAAVQNSGIDSFSVLCRALIALDQATPGSVYPPPRPATP